MARIFVTGSSTGLGLLAGQRLAREGHAVVLLARNEPRADDARQVLRSAEDVIVGDLQTIRGAVDLAEKANALGRFDAVTRIDTAPVAIHTHLIPSRYDQPLGGA